MNTNDWNKMYSKSSYTMGIYLFQKPVRRVFFYFFAFIPAIWGRPTSSKHPLVPISHLAHTGCSRIILNHIQSSYQPIHSEPYNQVSLTTLLQDLTLSLTAEFSGHVKYPTLFSTLSDRGDERVVSESTICI